MWWPACEFVRVLIHGINFAPELVGVGKYTGEMAEWLAAHGHDVTVLALRDRKAERERARAIVATTFAEGSGAQHHARAVAHDDLSGGVDIGVALDSVA